MSYFDARLNEHVSYGFQVSRRFQRTRVDLKSGYVNRNANTTRAKHYYTAPYNKIREAFHDELIAAFMATQAVLTFRFKDWTEYTLTNELIGTADGTAGQQLQIIKPYTFGSQTNSYRTITKPVDSTVYNIANGYVEDATALSVTAGGTPVAFTCDYNTGIVTITNAQTLDAEIRVTGEFDVPVFFSEESLDFVVEDYKAHTADIVLEEDLRTGSDIVVLA